MRPFLYGAVILTLTGGTAAAQSPLEGPLAPPDAAAPKTKPTSHHRKPAKVAHAAAPEGTIPKGPGYGGEEVTPPVSPTLSGTEAADPLSFGMKWNGSNDSARDTRVQNYNGDAQGTGAEVGMKLHF